MDRSQLLFVFPKQIVPDPRGDVPEERPHITVRGTEHVMLPVQRLCWLAYNVPNALHDLQGLWLEDPKDPQRPS
jgi:hypothetical protein